MFGPNKSTNYSGIINSHHREPIFFDKIKSIKKIFREKFSIPENYEILIITGSGTLAVESFIYSTNHKLKIVGVEGEFNSRWNQLLKTYNKLDSDSDKSLMIQLETSCSTVNKFDNPYFVDAVSAFPYYDIPKNAKAWATVSSKILGAAPVLGILVIDREIYPDLISTDVFSYMNVSRMLKSDSIFQTHHTPAMALYDDFLQKLEAFDLTECRNEINLHSDLIVDAIGEENIIGDRRCPVLTIKDGIIPNELCLKYNLYGSHVQGHKTQIFTYVEKTSDYENLAKEIKKIR
ncbi:MAG: hypothetical protein N4A49_00310 [Marinifilaceae bacterium]|jgi:aspartate aminotransferase-like enzyme|nr:hypothetical protein [Marinifilaceae bacterium]